MYKVPEAFRRLQNHVSILWLRHFCSKTGLGSQMKGRSSMVENVCVGGVKVVTCCVWGIIGWDWFAMNLAICGMSEVGEVQVHVHVAV